MSPYRDYLVQKEKYQDLIREAEQDRLRQIAKLSTDRSTRSAPKPGRLDWSSDGQMGFTTTTLWLSFSGGSFNLYRSH